MGYAVAVAAFGELGKHAGRVRCAVAALALWYHLMLCLVTGYAAQVLVLESTGREKLIGCLMASGTVLGRCLVAVRHCQRHMGLVALLAVVLSHLFGVWLMALYALRDLSMRIVAEGACKSCVLALVFTQLYDLLRVTGQTGVCDVASHLDIQWSMRIAVATIATCKLEVRLPFMTLAAERDDFLDSGRMSVVAILTADSGLVLCAVCSDVGRCLGVTFCTVVVRQFWPLCCRLCICGLCLGRCRCLRLCGRGCCSTRTIGKTLNRYQGKAGKYSNPCSARLDAHSVPPLILYDEITSK